jgi:hypothetical protein
VPERRNAQIRRQWLILRTIDDGAWWSIDEIIEAAGIGDRHRRTVLRDMEVLMTVFPISRRQGDRIGRTVRPGIPGYLFEFRLRKKLFSGGSNK